MRVVGREEGGKKNQNSHPKQKEGLGIVGVSEIMPLIEKFWNGVIKASWGKNIGNKW